MSMKKYVIPIAVALVAATQAVVAEEKEKGGWLPGEFDGSVALTSDYIFRGISQTGHEPALQGSINYSIDTGFQGTKVFAGVWGSNVDFNDGDEAQLELDWSFGIGGELAGLEWTLGGIYYHYPGASHNLNYDYWEIPLTLSYALNDLIGVGAQYYYAPEFFADSGEAHYINVGATFKPPIKWFDLALDGSIGHQWIEKNGRYGTDDYLDWKLGATVTIKGIDLGVAYTDTDLGKSECGGGTNLCEARAVFTIGASF